MNNLLRVINVHMSTGCLGRAIDATELQWPIIIIPSALVGDRTQQGGNEVSQS